MDISVKLRQKKLLGSRHSLYLDFYPPILHPQTGKLTRREFLLLYILDKPKTFFDHEHNNETLQLAEEIRKKRDLQLNNPESFTKNGTESITGNQYTIKRYTERALKLRQKVSKIGPTINETKNIKTKNVKELKSQEFLTVRDVAKLLNCSIRSVYNDIKSGKIKATNISQRLIRIKRSDLDKLFE